VTAESLLLREVLCGFSIDNKKPPICGQFYRRKEPSDGLEPSTPSLPSNNEAGTAGTAGKPQARRSRKPKESPEEE
jgi:hypothetical protein